MNPLQAWARGRGLVVRRAADPDFPLIKRIAVSSFPVPVGWATGPDRAAHYEPAFCRANAFGEMHAVVAEHVAKPALAGYCFYQVRNDGDLYVQEIAANPPASDDKVCKTGTLLMAHVVKLALSLPDRRHITANISQYYSASYSSPLFRKEWPDPLLFYLKLGFEPHRRYQGGYAHDRLDRDANDTWIVAAPEIAWTSIESRLGGIVLDA